MFVLTLLPMSEGELPSESRRQRRSSVLALTDWMCVPSNPYVEALTPSVTAFGDRASKEAIKLQSGHQGGALVR